MPAQPILYTFGYLNPRADRIVADLLAVGATLVDIRYVAASARYDWCYEALCRRYPGNVYMHVPELGNELYRQALTGNFQEPHIKLHDPETGMRRLERILNAYQRRVAIFCACASRKTCHRILVADMARQRFGVQVIHL